MSDLDGLRDMLEAVAVSRETDAKIKGTVPPVGAAWGAGGTVQVPDTATDLINRGLVRLL